MEGLELLRAIWGAQPGKYVCVSTRNTLLPKDNPDRWQDKMFSSIDLALAFVERKADEPGIDLYFAPMTFNEKRRDKKQVAPVKYLWQDLDHCSPDKIPDKLKPTILWESSPGRFHALWELENTVDLGTQQPVNRALAYKLAPLGADKGGWDATQVLRIPGTRNWKYADGPLVTLRGATDKPVSINRLGNLLDVGNVRDDDEKASDGPTGAQGLSLEVVLAKHRGKISRKVLGVLLADSAPEGKRSDTLWWLGHELMKAGLGSGEVYVLLKGSVWNKYEGRGDEEERLTHEIARAFEDEVLGDSAGEGGGKGNRRVSDDEDDEEDGPSLSLTFTSFEQLMGRLDSNPGWLVDGVWTRRSHGIVAGEPKSFKSTLLGDFAVSVASGDPFLGRFQVHEQGPVVIIQNENADWIMQDRMAKVMVGKKLVGSSRWLRDEKALEVSWPQQLPIHFLNQQGYSIMDPIHKKILEKAIGIIKPVLIIFDPLYLMFDGDLNQAKDLNPALQWLLHLKQKFNTAVVLVHHFRKGQGSNRGGQNMLGSATLHGWIESAWYLRNRSAESADDSESEEDADQVDDESVNKTAAAAEITLEREFRGAGMFPKMDIQLKMGAFGEAKYAVEVKRHVPQEKADGEAKQAKKQAKDSEVIVHMLNAMGNSSERWTIKALSEETGASQRKVKEMLESQESLGRVRYEGRGRGAGWSLVRAT